jgi:hypothetical protein
MSDCTKVDWHIQASTDSNETSDFLKDRIQEEVFVTLPYKKKEIELSWLFKKRSFKECPVAGCHWLIPSDRFTEH